MEKTTIKEEERALAGVKPILTVEDEANFVP